MYFYRLPFLFSGFLCQTILKYIAPHFSAVLKPEKINFITFQFFSYLLFFSVPFFTVGTMPASVIHVSEQ